MFSFPASSYFLCLFQVNFFWVSSIWLQNYDHPVLLSCIVSNGKMFKYVGQKSKDTKINFKKQLSGQLD